MSRRRRIALIIFLIVDVGYILWGAMAAFWLDHLTGPHGVPILPAGYEGYTHSSWAAIASASPPTASYMEVLYRTYGVYNLAFGLMTVAIALTAFRRGERWAWWALLVGNTIALVGAIIYDRSVSFSRKHLHANQSSPYRLSNFGFELFPAARAGRRNTRKDLRPLHLRR